MKSYNEDEEFLELVRKKIAIDEKLNGIVAVDDKVKLERKREKIKDQYMNSILQLDRIRIRETPYGKGVADLLRNHLGYGPREMKEIWKDYFQDILEYHEDSELIDRERFTSNYFKLIPPYVRIGTRIPEEIRNIYHESRWCFVYGQYSAAVALCRTIIEAVLKSKYNLQGDIKELVVTAKKRGMIRKETAWNADKVRLFANKILHKARCATEKEAKNAIDHTLVFLEEVYL